MGTTKFEKTKNRRKPVLLTVNGGFVSENEHLAAANSANHQSRTLILSALIGIIYRSTAARWLATGSVTRRR